MTSEIVVSEQELAQRRDATDNILALIKNGDLSKLTSEQQLTYYKHECERMGLDPMARPLEFVVLSGQLRLYAKRVAGDMLAAKHHVSTTILEGPTVVEVGKQQLLVCRARASFPDGRVADDVGSVAIKNLENDWMKVVTKALRRVTLRICGWGGLDESELETIPDARIVDMPAEPQSNVTAPSKQLPAPTPPAKPAAQATVELPAGLSEALRRNPKLNIEQAGGLFLEFEKQLTEQQRNGLKGVLQGVAGCNLAELNGAIAEAAARNEPEQAPPASAALLAFQKEVVSLESVNHAAEIWIRHRPALKGMTESERKTAWQMLWKRVEEKGSMTGGSAWLTARIAEEDKKAKATAPPEASNG